MTVPHIVAIVVTWQSAHHVERCLDALASQEGDFDLEIIVVDNASTDATPDLLRARSDIRPLFLSRNRGYAAATNLALALAPPRCDFLLLVNPDCVLDELCVQCLLAVGAETGAAGVSAQLRNPDGSWQSFARREPDLGWVIALQTRIGKLLDTRLTGGSFARHRTYALELDTQLSTPLEVDVPIAACLLVHRAWTTPQFMDEVFPLYFNDGDWFRRVRSRGGRFVIAPGATATHEYGGSTAAVPRDRIRAEFVTSFREYARRWWPKSRRLTALGLLLLDGLLVIAVGRLRGHYRHHEFARGTLGGLGFAVGSDPWLSPRQPFRHGRRGRRRARATPPESRTEAGPPDDDVLRGTKEV